MKDIYVVSLKDSQGNYHVIYTNIKTDEDREKLNSLLCSWNPPKTTDRMFGSVYLGEDILNSLKELTGFTFNSFTPDYSRKYGGDHIRNLPSTYDW